MDLSTGVALSADALGWRLTAYVGVQGFRIKAVPHHSLTDDDTEPEPTGYGFQPPTEAHP